MGSLCKTEEGEKIIKEEEKQSEKQSKEIVDTIVTDQTLEFEFGEMGFVEGAVEGGGAGELWPAAMWTENLGDSWWSFEGEEEKGWIWDPYFDPEVLNFRVYEENLEVDWEYELWDFEEFNEVPKA